jgi:hypothetical protein
MDDMSTGTDSGLAAEDRERLDQFEARLQLVRDRTRGVAEGWATGLYLWGEGGISKSFTVLEELGRLKVAYRLTNSRLTGRGLFDLLSDHPDRVHVLEDRERLCRDPNAAGVLRSALWGQKGKLPRQHLERVVTWRTFEQNLGFVFTGGIIFSQNCPLDDLPGLRALKTRIAHLRLQPTNAEVGQRRGHPLGTTRPVSATSSPS